MITIRLSGQVTADHQLVAEVPEDVPPGKIELVIEVPEADESEANSPRAQARAKLAAAGALSTIWKAPPDAEPATEEELIELGTLPPGSPSASDLVIEMRARLILSF